MGMFPFDSFGIQLIGITYCRPTTSFYKINTQKSGILLQTHSVTQYNTRLRVRKGGFTFWARDDFLKSNYTLGHRLAAWSQPGRLETFTKTCIVSGFHCVCSKSNLCMLTICDRLNYGETHVAQTIKTNISRCLPECLNPGR